MQIQDREVLSSDIQIDEDDSGSVRTSPIRPDIPEKIRLALYAGHSILGWLVRTD